MVVRSRPPTFGRDYARYRSRASLVLLSDTNPGPLRGPWDFASGRPEASFLPSKSENPSCLSAAGVLVACGEGGIRTLDTGSTRILAFQASPFSHSGTSPVKMAPMPAGRACFWGLVQAW